MKIRIIIAAMVVVMLTPVFCAAGDVIVIGNQAVKTSMLSRQDVQYIFLGKKSAWNDGEKIVFALQNDSGIHKKFLKKYIRKSPIQFANHWKKQIFTGKGSTPQSFKNDEEMIKFVSETKGAIGYVSSEADVNKVKTIKIK